MEVAWPPMCCAVSKIVMSNLSGWAARVAAQDCPCRLVLVHLVIGWNLETYHPSGSSAYDSDSLLLVLHDDCLSPTQSNAVEETL
jgi:hypothetical protein